ncbi:TniQ family protein [Muricoccus vinaceus]|uniref:TniQ family protein n=1 Tax=Muricoccus vinaceus TaxID=424704 RepID=A0ABV6IW53_9PROT
MTRATGLLPLVPDPKLGEHLLSWVDRLAARYGMTSSEFLAALSRKVGTTKSPIPDRLGEQTVEPFLKVLAERSGVELQMLCQMLPANQNGTLRGAAGRSKEVEWYRGWIGWCQACTREDVGACGEVFGRTAWYSRHHLICERHRRFLTDHCPQCIRQTVEPLPISGRLRLVCRSCAFPIDGLQEREHVALDSLSILYLGDATLEHLTAFQVDLDRALAGLDCCGPWQYGSSAADFIDAATDLCMAFAGPPLQTAGDSRVLTGLSVSDGAAGFAAAASLLAWLNGVDIGVRYKSIHPALSLSPLRLEEFLKHLSYAERVWLRSRRIGRDDRLWRELSRTCAPFVPCGGFTGQRMTPWSVLLLSDLRGKEFIRSRPLLRNHQRPPKGAPRSPTAIVESLIGTLRQELASQNVPGFGGGRKRTITPGRYAAMVETDISALVQHTRRQLGDEPAHAVLHPPPGHSLLHPSGWPPEGHEFIHYLQGRRRRTMRAALVRLSLLVAREPSRGKVPALDPDEIYLRSIP